jgi:hypothetical protein
LVVVVVGLSRRYVYIGGLCASFYYIVLNLIIYINDYKRIFVGYVIVCDVLLINCLCLFLLSSFLDKVSDIKQPNYTPTEQVCQLLIQIIMRCTGCFTQSRKKHRRFRVCNFNELDIFGTPCTDIVCTRGLSVVHECLAVRTDCDLRLY